MPWKAVRWSLVVVCASLAPMIASHSASAQFYASAVGSATPHGTGNPFLQEGPPRSTLLADVPLSPSDAIMATARPSENFHTPNPEPAAFGSTSPSLSAEVNAILPNYDDSIALAQAPTPQPSSTGTPMPGPSPTGGAAVPLVANVDAASRIVSPAVHGVALLKQKATDAAEHPLAPAIRWAEDALRQMQTMRDYTCTFTKRELIDGRLHEPQVMYVKSRPRPLSVYLYFLAPSDVKGQEALYVEGRNGGNLLAHPVGFKQTLVGTLSLAPTDPIAMEGNLHPITDFGLRRLTERYLEGLRHDAQFGECEFRVIEGALVNQRPCTCIQITHPVPRREFLYHITRLYVDDEWNVPCRYESYGWPRHAGEAPYQIEEYTYTNIKFNQNLTDADFDPANPRYSFN